MWFYFCKSQQTLESLMLQVMIGIILEARTKPEKLLVALRAYGVSLAVKGFEQLVNLGICVVFPTYILLP